jgi:hypothetical protein
VAILQFSTLFNKRYDKKNKNFIEHKMCVLSFSATEHSKGNKTIPGKVATIRTEDGHK